MCCFVNMHDDDMSMTAHELRVIRTVSVTSHVNIHGLTRHRGLKHVHRGIGTTSHIRAEITNLSCV